MLFILVESVDDRIERTDVLIKDEETDNIQLADTLGDGKTGDRFRDPDEIDIAK